MVFPGISWKWLVWPFQIKAMANRAGQDMYKLFSPRAFPSCKYLGEGYALLSMGMGKKWDLNMFYSQVPLDPG